MDNILVDARALQDPNYRFRGVGQHGAALLSALRHHAWERRPRLTAMVDHGAEPLQAEHADLFDAVTTVVRAPREDCAWLLSLSPMTHDPLWLSALLLDPTVFKVALFYDLIPLEMPYRYLRDARSRADYLVSFAWLGRYDAFAAISDHSRRALVRARGIDERKTFVTGVAVRPALEPQPDDAPLPRLERSHILVSGGGDPRKNPECVLLAHARLSAPKVGHLPIQVFGGYSATARSDLRSVYAKAGGKASDLMFLPHLTDAQMREAYRTAVLTVVPSQAEGFSIPIVESAAAGTPVLVSDVDAHPELVTDGRLRFNPGDPDSLRSAIERILADDDIWETARDAAAQLWPRYTEEAVGARFVEALLDRVVTAPAVLRRARPRIAVLTPLPPAATGIADFSIRTLKALSRHASLDLFTDTSEAVAEPHFDSLGSVRQARLSARAFDATIAVLGNSDHHRGIFEFLLERGGAAIAHDARMLGFYRLVLGEERALAVGRRETRDVTVDGDKIMRWLDDERDLPALFLSEIVSSASPLFVYSKRMAREIRHQYGVMPVVLPYAQLRSFAPSSARAKAARARLGIADGERVICSFGIVASNKAPDVLLWAVKLLARWGVASRLVMVGSISQAYGTILRRHIDELDLASHIYLFEENVSEQVYSDFLSAADAAVQLRTYGFGQLSGALNDCIAAALPTVANEDLAEALDAPAFVRRVPDDLSPVLVAEALLDILERERGTLELIEEAERYAGLHSPEEHARNLIAGLGFSPVENA